MDTVAKLDARIEADGRTAYIIGGVLKVYDRAEALSMLNPVAPLGAAHGATLLALNMTPVERRAERREYIPPNARGTLERFPWEAS